MRTSIASAQPGDGGIEARAEPARQSARASNWLQETPVTGEHRGGARAGVREAPPRSAHELGSAQDPPGARRSGQGSELARVGEEHAVAAPDLAVLLEETALDDARAEHHE